MKSWTRNTPTLIPMRVNVTNGPRAERFLEAVRATRRGAATVPPVVAWSGQRIPTGP